MSKEPSIASASVTAQSILTHMLACGYDDSLLQSNAVFTADGVERSVAWAGFSQRPFDARSACVAAVDLNQPDETEAARYRDLGAPTLFGCHGNRLLWFAHETNGTRLIDPIPAKDVRNFFATHKDEFRPDRIYRAKTSGKFVPSHQLDFVDAGLLPLLEHSSGDRLGRMVESLVGKVHDVMPKGRQSKSNAQWVFQSVFWLLAARLLRDKSVQSFKTVDIADPDDVFARVGRHYRADAPPLRTAAEREAMRAAAAMANSFPSLANITTESLAYVYENTMVSQEVRDALGTHRTPSWLVDYILWQLAPWIEQIPSDERHVVEPACGHSAFLVGAVRLLRQFGTAAMDDTARREYLRKHIHGIEMDDFAREIGRLSLTLADVPNPNGWDLIDADMYVGNALSKQVKRAGIVLANPPFEGFTEDERKYYKKQPGLGIFHVNKAAELFARVVRDLPAGGVFGLVMPESVLSSNEGKPFRTQLLREFELREVCSLPDKVFENSEIESAIVLARRRMPALGTSVYVRRVYDWDLRGFTASLAPSTESLVPQSSFLLRDEVNLRLPDLHMVWDHLGTHDRLGKAVIVQKGFEFKGEGELGGRVVISSERKAGWVEAFLRADSDYGIYTMPETRWVDYSPKNLRRAGAVPRGAQVVMNYARVSRQPWRLKASLDPKGMYLSSRFLMFRATKSVALPVDVLWAILNSPLANAYAFSVTSKREVTPSEWRDFPLPRLSPDDSTAIARAAKDYRDAAEQLAGRNSKSDRDDARVQQLLVRMDASVLRAYALPPGLEQKMLAIFDDVARPGVGCTFTGYPRVPETVTLPFHLRLLLPRFHELGDLALAGTISRRQQAELKDIEDQLDAYEMNSPRMQAFRQRMSEMDREHQSAMTELKQIEARLRKQGGGGGE